MQQVLWKNETLWTRVILGVSIAIPAVVAVLFFAAKPQVETGLDLRAMPRFHAALNSLTAVFLCTGFVLIRKKKIVAHKACMLIALLLSVIFLVSYVVYHSLTEPTAYGADDWTRPLYYSVLISHICLAIVIVPLVLMTLLRALSKNYAQHKKLARYTLPLWLYVAVTGVVVYFMISPYYS